MAITTKDWTKGMTSGELQRYNAEQDRLYWKRRDADKQRDEESDAEFIKKHGAVPGTQKWYEMTDKANSEESLRRRRDEIQYKIDALKRPELYNLPEGEGAIGIDRPRLKDFSRETGIYGTPEGGYSNVGSIAGPRPIDRPEGRAEHERLTGLIGGKGYKPQTRAEKIAFERDKAEAKRLSKETPYRTLTRERDEDAWGAAKDILEAWEVGEKTQTEEGEELVIFTDKKGELRQITKTDVENAKNRFEELDRKLGARLPLFKRMTQEGPFVRKRIPGRKTPKRSQSQIIRTGRDPQGRKIVQYMDGTLAYAD